MDFVHRGAEHAIKLTNFWYKVQIWAFEETKVHNDASTNLKASSLSDIIY